MIVMTDAVLQSEITRKEWRYARQQGACVYDLYAQCLTFVEHLPPGCKATRVESNALSLSIFYRP